MNISSISYTSSTAYLYQTTLDSSSSDSSSSDSIKSLFSSLSDALSSGDSSTASSLWSKLDTAFKAQSGQTDDSSDDNNPLKKDMLKLKSYIEQGDTASATKMLDRIQKATSRGGPGGPPPPPPADSSQASTKVSDLLSSIGSALTSGDTSTASDYLSQLDELLASKSQASTTGSGSSSASSSSSTEEKNPLKEAIAQLQQYLQSGDTTSTASLFQDIQRAVNHNPWTPELGTEINSFA